MYQRHGFEVAGKIQGDAPPACRFVVISRRAAKSPSLSRGSPVRVREQPGMCKRQLISRPAERSHALTRLWCVYDAPLRPLPTRLRPIRKARL